MFSICCATPPPPLFHYSLSCCDISLSAIIPPFKQHPACCSSSSRFRCKYLYNTGLTKSNAVPLHAMAAQGGERRYSSYSYLTSALDEGEWPASRPSHALPPGKEPPIPIGREAGWAPEPVWTQGLEEKSSASVGDRIPIVQPVVRHCTDWATAAPNSIYSRWISYSLFLHQHI
jgi:hypothetical protein